MKMRLRKMRLQLSELSPPPAMINAGHFHRAICKPAAMRYQISDRFRTRGSIDLPIKYRALMCFSSSA